MQLEFTKGKGKFDRLELTRSDGGSETIQCPKQGIIPHDRVHYAVEHHLHRRGFLARVKGGEAASFRMQGEGESDSVARLVEVFQVDAWSGGDSALEEMLALYALTCEARGCPALPISDEDVESVRAELRALTVRWNAVAVGDSLRLTF